MENEGATGASVGVVNLPLADRECRKVERTWKFRTKCKTDWKMSGKKVLCSWDSGFWGFMFADREFLEWVFGPKF